MSTMNQVPTDYDKTDETLQKSPIASRTYLALVYCLIVDRAGRQRLLDILSTSETTLLTDLL